MGVVAEADTPAGVLVRGTDGQYEALEAAGFRVKLLPDTNLLRIGRYTIDVETDAVPDVPRELDISAAELPGWPHHLVQLAGPPIDAWVRAIEARGLDVVEPVSGYGVVRVCAERRGDGAARSAVRRVDRPAEARLSDLLQHRRERRVRVGWRLSEQRGRGVRAAIEAAGARILDEARQPATYGGEYADLQSARRRDRGAGPHAARPLGGAGPAHGARRRARIADRGREPRRRGGARHGAGSRLPIVAGAGGRGRHRRHDCDRRQRRGRQRQQRHGGGARRPARTSGGVRRLLERRRCHRHGRSRHARGRHRAGKCRDRTRRRRRRRTIFSGDKALPLERATSPRTRFDSSVYPRPTFATLARIRRRTAPRS